MNQAGRHKPTTESQPIRPPRGADGHLLDRLRGKDPQALATLVQEYGDMLTKAAWLYLGDAHAAEDAVQDTFLAAWDGARRTGTSSPLRGWLLGILMNRCRKYIRACQRRRRRELLAARQRTAADAPPDEPAPLEALRQAVADLDVHHREVIILRFWQALSVEQTADALGVPPGTVKSRCHAAVAQLRAMLDRRQPS